MHIYNFIQLGLVSISYIVLIFGLAFIMLRPFTGRRPFSDKILLYFVAGNFYVMNIVFLLLFLRCTSRVITITTLVVGAVGLRYLFDRNLFKKSISGSIRTFALLSEGVYGWNFFRRERLSMLYRNFKSRWSLVLRNYLVETIGFIGCLGIHAYYMGYRLVKYSGFGASDEPVHLNWIQSMLMGEIFDHGVYPFGFHNVIYAIIKVYGVQAYTGIRYFSFVMNMLMLLMLFLLLKKVCRSRYAPLIGVFLYIGADILTNVAWGRLQFSLPQEFGMLFLYPMLISYYNYICGKDRKDLILFGLCFAMTLYVHYYVTIIALILCLGVGVSSLYRLIREKLFFKILICGILSAVIGILPMGVGLATGHGLQGSLYWAMGVIQGNGDNESTDNLNETDVTDKSENREIKQERKLFDTIISILYTIRNTAVSYLMKNFIFYIMTFSMLLILLKTGIHILTRSKRNETFLQLGLVLSAAILLIMLSSIQLGLPVIIDAARVCVFLGYIIPVLLCMPLELFYELFELRGWLKPANFFILTVICLTMFLVYSSGGARKLGYSYLMQTEGSVKTFYKITEEYDDYTWTIVSSVDEYSMVLDCGRHEELTDFLRELKSYNGKSSLDYPTENIFFFIEKRPIGYIETFNLKEGIGTFPEITEEDAKESFSGEYEGEPSEYYQNQRNMIMAKAYFWAKEYMRYFPNEMSVFYEDDSFICYQLKQDPYYKNNLLIDYGYNAY